MSWRSSWLFAAVLACGLLLRVLVPDGWMPAADGTFALEPCPAAAPLAVAPMHHGGGKHQDPRHDPSKSQDCPFAPLMASGLLPTPRAAVPESAPAEALHHTPSRLTTFLTADTSRLPPSTGPPART